MNNKTLLCIAVSFGIETTLNACTVPESPLSNRNTIPHPRSVEHKAAQASPHTARETP